MHDPNFSVLGRSVLFRPFTSLLLVFFDDWLGVEEVPDVEGQVTAIQEDLLNLIVDWHWAVQVGVFKPASIDV